MVSRHRLYQTFGELLYLVAMADGIISKAETDELNIILKDHPELDAIKWSFNYEVANSSSVDLLYKRIIETYTDNGPDEAYEFFIKSLEQLAKADGVVDKSEQDLINKFSSDLLTRFKTTINF